MRLTPAILCAALAIAGCKIVAKSEATDTPVTDEERMAALVEGDWEGRVLPRLRETAAPAGEVLEAIGSDFTAARAAFGTTTGAEGAPSVFVVRGEGTVIGANLESRAARLNVDIDGDGEADLDLQLGPVIRGTALRDGLPFYVFTDFRDQIEFAKLSRALNDAAHAGMPAAPEDPGGRIVAFTGVFSMGASTDPLEVVPVDLTWP